MNTSGQWHMSGFKTWHNATFKANLLISHPNPLTSYTNIGKGPGWPCHVIIEVLTQFSLHVDCIAQVVVLIWLCCGGSAVVVVVWGWCRGGAAVVVLWWFPVDFGGLVDFGGSLWTLVVHCELWWFTVNFGDSLWTLVVPSGLWWFTVKFGDSLWTLLVHCGKITFLVMSK